MITKADIENIILDVCEPLGITDVTTEPPTLDDKTGDGLKGEKLEIFVKKEGDGTRWLPRFVDVNVCIPDFTSGLQNAPRLEAVEKIAGGLFDKAYASGIMDGSRYRFKRESIGIEQDKPLKCHYVNVRVLFETINVI
jgi:hypothetical protein